MLNMLNGGPRKAEASMSLEELLRELSETCEALRGVADRAICAKILNDAAHGINAKDRVISKEVIRLTDSAYEYMEQIVHSIAKQQDIEEMLR